MRQMPPDELKALMDAGETPVIIDVREHWELEVASLAPATHIPMGELVQAMDTLDRGAETVVLCHHGMRSAQVAAYLEQNGFARVSNLDGGIDAWSRTVDPDVPQY